MSKTWLSGYDDGVAATLSPYPDRTLLDYLRESAAKWPDRPALLFKGATIDYGTLHRLSDRFGSALVALGIKPGDRVALCLPNSPQFVIAEVGAWKAGAIVAPINPTYTDRELEDALNATGAETVVVLQLRAWLSPAMKEWTDTIMLPLPLFHTYGNTGVQSLAWINHNPISLTPNPREIGDVLDEINDVKPAFICAVPTLLIALLGHSRTKAGQVDFSSIKLCFCGAAALMAETQKRFEELTGGVIVEGYSLTEAQMAVVANPVVGPKKISSVGLPLPDVEVRILDSDDGVTPIAAGDVGEIVISAPQLMLGYWNRPEETREMIHETPDGERLLFTGDLGYLDKEGYLFIVDRKKDMIKTSGYQVWPREIEEVTAAHPAVQEVGVAGLPDKMRGEKAKAWIVLKDGMTATEGEMKAWCRERLASYKVPAKYEFVSDLPKTQVGKVLRRALRETSAAADA